jgi:hypothetical protein
MKDFHKKEAPLLGMQGSGGGLGFLAGGDSVGPPGPWYNNLNPFNDNSQVGYWKLESANPRNENFTGDVCSTLYGTPSYTPLGTAGYWNNPVNSTLNTNANRRNSYPLSFSIWCYKETGDWGSGDQNQLLVNWSIGGQRLSICNVDWNGGGGANDWEWSIMYGGTNHWTFAPSARTENAWMHIVYCVQGNNDSGHRLYQDGGSALSANNRGGGHGGSAGNAIGGNSTSNEDWNGWMYNVRLFNKMLTQSEAAQLYANDKPPGA